MKLIFLAQHEARKECSAVHQLEEVVPPFSTSCIDLPACEKYLHLPAREEQRENGCVSWLPIPLVVQTQWWCEPLLWSQCWQENQVPQGAVVTGDHQAHFHWISFTKQFQGKETSSECYQAIGGEQVQWISGIVAQNKRNESRQLMFSGWERGI